MADVMVGQVRRPPPVLWSVPGRYPLPPFEVLRREGPCWWVRYVDEPREWKLSAGDVERCPLWPSEHEQYKDAKGYEVKP